MNATTVGGNVALADTLPVLQAAAGLNASKDGRGIGDMADDTDAALDDLRRHAFK